MRKMTAAAVAAVIALAASAVAAAGAEDLKESLAPKLQRIIEFQAEVGSLRSSKTASRGRRRRRPFPDLRSG